MISHLLARVTAPYFIGLLWFVAILFLLRPGDWPGGPLPAGVLGGLAIAVSSLVPPGPRFPKLRVPRIASIGMIFILAGLVGAELAGGGGLFRVLSTPGGGLSAGAFSLILFEGGLALVLAAGVGTIAARLVSEWRRP